MSVFAVEVSETFSVSSPPAPITKVEPFQPLILNTLSPGPP